MTYISYLNWYLLNPTEGHKIPTYLDYHHYRCECLSVGLTPHGPNTSYEAYIKVVEETLVSLGFPRFNRRQYHTLTTYAYALNKDYLLRLDGFILMWYNYN